MTEHNQAMSTFHGRYDDDNNNDDFDEDAANTSSRRYKTKSPLHRSDHSFRRHGRLRGQFSNSGRTHQEMKRDSIGRRVLSACTLKINEVLNQNKDILLQLKDLREENKLLKKTQHIHNKNLQKFEDRESELPLLIQRQHNEVRSLHDQIRKWREKYTKTDRYLRDVEDELDKVKLKLKKLKSLADEKDLPERSDLNNKLNKSELAIEEREVKIKKLERYMQNLEKNHKHKVGIERARMKEINKMLLQLKEENDKLSNTVKEKDKEIQVKNIYVTRAQIKPPHHLPNSHNGTPHGTPPPHHHQPTLSETNTITPKERSKQMEEKRRGELRRQREQKKHHDKLKREKEMFAVQEKEKLERIEREKIERRQCEEKELQEKEMNKQAERKMQERQLQDEREQKMKQEAEERHQLEQERKEHDERARAEKQEWEEREIHEHEQLEQEHRAAEERQRLDEDESLQAEKKKKDEILQKLWEIDEGGAKMKDKDKSAFNDPFFITQDRENSINSALNKKNYIFSKPVENLHKGKPTHKDSNTNLSLAVGGGRKFGKSDVDDLEMVDYNPKFGSKKGVNGPNSTATTTRISSLFHDDTKSTNTETLNTVNKTGKKSHLMEELFGSNITPKHDIISSPEKSSKKPDQSTIRPSFPWDNDGSPKKQTLKTKSENSVTLFGGGTALVSDEELHKSNLHSYASLPRRQKQTNTAFHNQLVVNAINNIEDEVKEVIL